MSEPGQDKASDRHWADAWLYAVLSHQHLTAGAKALAALLRLHWNPETLVSSPSVQGLALRTAQTERAVEKQRRSLRALGLLSWEARAGRVRNSYRLSITPNVWRELARICPEHPALVGASIPQQPAGVGKSEPRTAVAPTPNRGGANPRPAAGQTQKPIKPFGGAGPRAPDGAAVAAALGEPGRILAEQLGVAVVGSWFDGATIEGTSPARIIADKAFRANWIRNHFPKALDVAFPGGWEVVARTAPVSRPVAA
jgi:hypothetical protein